eukprot:TRINITY_DN2832_c0_g1_i1.p1 TRINITY_DN2832_c0_g1~~TRINITY_DN2832_c0_g1_i1.p1  ORF type:complete len:271 (-),score=44.58 TRINITY_DN2832_c0_g1_i1:108-920(-)
MSFSKESPLIPLLSGMIGGMSSSIASYPIQKIVTQIQAGQYKSFSNAISTILKEGVKINELYIGLKIGMITSALKHGIYYFWYVLFRKTIIRYCEKTGRNFGIILDLFIGLLAGVATLFFLTPLFVVHHRLILEKKKDTEKPKNATQILKELWNEEGISGLFRGFGSGLILTINPAIQYMAYEQLKNKFPKMSFSLLGVISKLISTILTYPFLTIMVKDQIEKKKKKRVKSYDSSLFNGLDAKIYQNIISNASLFYFRRLAEKFFGIGIK